MRPRLAATFTAFALSFGAHAAVAAATPPSTVQNAICSPVYQADGKAFSAGTAFALDLPQPVPRTLLVTALHVFGPAGGLDKEIPAAELARRVSLAGCQALGLDEIWYAGRALTVPGAHAMDDGPHRDVAAFPLDTARAAIHPVHLRLAAAAPKVGDSVWLLAQVPEGAPPSQLLHHAVVRSSTDQALQYAFDNVGLNLQGTSGAPVVNAAGEVVGTNLGGGTLPGKLIGVGNSLTSLRALLNSAK
jgi:hypothetical protein